MTYQIFLNFKKGKNLKKEVESKFKIVSVNDGIVDLDKFEIKIRDSKAIYKVIRDGNELKKKR